VRFINQKNIGLGAEVKKTMQIYLRVKCIVVITDDAVSPQGQIQRKLKRADPVLPGKGFNDRAGIGLKLIDVFKRPFDFAKIVPGIFTQFRIAARLRAKTNFFFRCQGDTPELQTGLTHIRQRSFRHQSARCFGRQIKDPSGQSLPQCFDSREKGGNGLAHPGG